jgi:hypothetical protein
MNADTAVASDVMGLTRVAPVSRRFFKRGDAPLDEPRRKTPEGLALAAEVRAHFKAMPQSERLEFAMEAIEAGDKSSALLHAQPFLSGLDVKSHATLRAQAAAKFAPIDSAQHAATSAAIDRVMNAGSSLFGRYTKVLKLKSSPQAVAAEKMKALAGG